MLRTALISALLYILSFDFANAQTTTEPAMNTAPSASRYYFCNFSCKANPQQELYIQSGFAGVLMAHTGPCDYMIVGVNGSSFLLSHGRDDRGFVFRSGDTIKLSAGGSGADGCTLSLIFYQSAQ